MSDKIHRFIFDTHGIRGELVKLNDSCERMLKDHPYPTILATLLQQAAAVNVLLATTLKFEGKISIQLQTNRQLKMLVVQTTHKLGFRGLVRFDQQADYSNSTFADLTEGGQMTITIEPLKGKRYQGIVPLNGKNLAECVENYFNQSEQLETRIWLFNDEEQVFGLMLQALPDMLSQDSFEHLVYLASTLTKEECLSVDSDILLHRLFHQESVRGLTVDPVKFTCGCSQQKMLNSLSLLPEEEINEILETKGQISVKCEFCLNQFRFSELDLKSHKSLQGNATKH
ncbi:Hsp33 family molecular chaperone HslO [Aliikangiella coralliicola]|uniref:Redox-regulated molecular chaperone Hsp33 n=1 Tax=Aliikangiella coralliicola TaxID=2592383 RepID=A0A545U7S5_9GAMM|nr:Hsp33 family molecular chaperone HslO [Aliikangiella coralliicola]TQV85511.1 redox-regulated molecular chaperone Hsp33 [Aliikangiella coralliicola]